MLEIQTPSASAPLKNLGLQQSLSALLARSVAMGVLGDATSTQLDGPAWRAVIGALQNERLLSSASLDLAPLLERGPAGLDAAEAARMTAHVDRIIETLGESPSPSTEWAAMRAVLGDEVLSPLVGVSESSLRRYAAASRPTPQAVAERLHWLAMVVADLAGGYNDFGIRRWFERPRAQLGGQSPRQTLGDAWTVDDDAARRVRALASALAGAQALAV